ncbi:LamG-like jellyroll fold domain-containing protein [Polaribacter sp.]|uniref:LamG-like jellyroll fold domain-containing protein n=1 Tax=Polaribacter sp. TaxID=1920175 RepID=UPI003F6CC90F
MKKSILIFILFYVIVLSNAQVKEDLWLVDNLTEIGGYDVEVIGNPKIITTSIGTAVEFNGINDGLIINNSPLAEAIEFTVEILFNPYSDGGVEQRFLHIQQDNDNRILIELRNNSNENWSLDTFIKSGNSNKTLLDYSFVHHLNAWHHAALVYKEGNMQHFVDGKKELEGTVNYKVVNSGQTSLGVRLNKVSWFKGAIHSLKITHKALNPDDFMEIAKTLTVHKTKENVIVSSFYPNPIISDCLLNYELLYASKVAISLYAMNGVKISSLFSGFKTKGNHELKLNFESLTSGVYFVEINSGREKSIQKIIVL